MIRNAPALLVAALVLLPAAALRADDAPSLVSADDAAKKVGKGGSVLVVFAKADSDADKAAQKAVADKRLAKSFKEGGVVTRVDPGDDAAAKTLGIDAEKNDCTVALDGYGLECGKHDKAPNAEALQKLFKTASDATAKKKKIEKAVEKNVAKAEEANKKGDTATACQLLVPTLEYEKTVPCEATQKARKLVDELTAKANDLLTKARSATGSSNFAEAHKLISQVNANFPIPAVQTDAKAAQKELSDAEARQSQR